MEEPDDELDLAEVKKKSKLPLIILIVFISSLVLAGTVIGTMYVAGLMGGEQSESTGDDEDEESDDEDGDDEEDGAADGPALYLALDPAFVVNFQGQGRAKFLQVSVEVMTRDQGILEAIQQHMPAIRNNLILLFSNQDYDNVSTIDGKEALREEALEEVQSILEEETGDPGVEAVYFTSFVMQ
jgi:flagellar FliL protein